jgi:hypothetical protein
VFAVLMVRAFAGEPAPVPLAVAEEALGAIAAASGGRVISCPRPQGRSVPPGVFAAGDRALFVTDDAEGVVLMEPGKDREEVVLRWSKAGCTVEPGQPVTFRARAERGELSTVWTERGRCSHLRLEDGWYEIHAVAGVPCRLAAGAPTLQRAERRGDLEVESPQQGAEVVVPLLPLGDVGEATALWDRAVATPGLSTSASLWLRTVRGDDSDFDLDPVIWR